MNSEVKTTAFETNINKHSDNNIFSELSKYRAELLGIALILISIAHLQSTGAILNKLNLTAFSSSTLRFFNLPGACGVKIFFFIAGFSSYFSLFKNPDDLSFYIRKAKRMFPYYYPMVLICLLIFKPNLMIIAGNLSLLGWWITPQATRWSQYFWFHQAIYIIYILTPIFFRILNNNKNNFLQIVLAWLLFFSISLAFYPEIKVQGVQVIPIFITGMLLCKLNIEKTHINQFFEPLIYSLGIFSFITLIKFFPNCGYVYSNSYMPRTSEHLLIWFISAAFLLLSLRFLIFINNYNNALNVKLRQMLSLLGKRALEIYLIEAFVLYQLLVINHAKFFEYLYNLIKPATIGHAFIIKFTICAVIICTILGILYGVTVDFILKKLSILYSKLKFRLLSLYHNN